MKAFPRLFQAIGLLITAAILAPPAVADTPTRPNVLLIFTDDHARWALGAYGNDEVHTPNFDRLAAEGMRFDRGFTKPVCSPSRAMLLTGLYSHRLAIPDYIPYGNPVHADNGLPAGTPTIASVLKSAGYATGLIGKWHLGYGERYYPERYGFDVAEGFRYVAPGLKLNGTGDIPYRFGPTQTMRLTLDPEHTDLLADRAISFLHKNANRPFFLYFSLYRPHLPWGPVPERDLAPYEGKPLTVPDPADFPGARATREALRQQMRLYYANITSADRNVGRVLDTLDELELADNTLIVFIGDNGFNVGQHGILGKGNARVLQIDEGDRIRSDLGRRPNMFDHSVLVPYIVRWPGVVEPGSSSDELVSTIDVLPTLIDITAAPAGRGLRLDGQSLLPLLTHREEDPATPPPAWRDAWIDTYDLIYNDEAHMRMIRTHHWKLVLYHDADERPLVDGARHELFDLEADPEELTNLYGDPSVADTQIELETRLKTWMRDAGVIQ
ncbi:MAG: sulfatase family protein [Planctomycetota bacterium]|jgi:uncharacterized sulfatase